MDSVPVVCIGILTFASLTPSVDSLKCYSCKATGNNEIDANIKCLEAGYLENCEEFYNYYDEVENPIDGIEPSEEYYYYDDTTQTDGQYIATKEDSQAVDPSKLVEETNRVGRPAQEDNPPDISKPRVRRAARQAKKTAKTAKATKKEEELVEGVASDLDAKKPADADTTKSGPTIKPTVQKKKEHYCYSTTSKEAWESYTVEKGCKKISYCKGLKDSNIEWSNPWNFCCDRSRCNVKLVKDKPQRVYNMGCRRTDDCIQGHNSRPVCPNYFKSCPKISTGHIKMECRSGPRTMATVKNTGFIRPHWRKEKKCFCAKGYFPKGPICTSVNSSYAAVETFNIVIFTATVTLLGLLTN